MGGSYQDGSQSLMRQPLPTKLPKVEAWPIHLAEPEPRGVEETLYEKFGYNDIDEIFQQSTTYSRWVQPSQDELANQVEYDMNDADKIWLDRLNAERKKEGLDAISYEFFEILMDKLEKEWFDLSKHFPKPVSDLVEDSKCTICDDGECEASNAIVFCDGCNLAVHQDCYGVPYIPEGQWLCRKCTVSPDRDVSCMLCPGNHGAFKQTVNGQWAHLLCAIWINETWVSNTVYMEPIDGIESIPKQRWRLICNLCKKRAGACIQCSKGSCYTAYHVTCAREHGLYLRLGTSSGATTTDGSGGANISYCDKHSRQVFGDEEDEERAMSEELTETRPKKRKLISHGDIGREASEEPLQTSKKGGRQSASRGPNDTFESGNASFALPPSAKKKKKKRIKQEIPIIPRFVYDRVWNHIKALRCTKKQAFVKMVCRYWSLKRSKRQGAPLLKRLHLEPWTASAATTRDATDLEREQRLELLLQLRNDLEKVRHLVELIRRRENEKLRRAQLFKQVIDAVIFPQTGLFRATLQEIQRLDGRHLFSKPVSRTDVPDYYNIVKHPMDWQTMYEKLDQNAYVTAGDFQADVNLVIYNALLYNTPDSLHGKAAIKLRNGLAPFMAKLGEFDDPNSEIHKRHRRYLDAIDDTYIDNLFRVDYPVPSDLPGQLDLTSAASAQVGFSGSNTALLPRMGVPEVLSSADIRASSRTSLGKAKRDEETLDTAAGFRAPKIFASISDLSNHFAATSRAGTSGTSGQAARVPRKSAKVLALEKRRQQNRDYRARVKARKLAEKARLEREAVIAAGGNPDLVGKESVQLPGEHQNAHDSINAAASTNIPDAAESSPSEPQDQRHSLELASIEPGPPKAEDIEQDPTVRRSEPQAIASISTVVPNPGYLVEGHLFSPSIASPRVNEWGAAIDRVEPPNDHEANLLFNEGWILPAGSKRRRASSANTETSGPVVKGRKASLPAASVSPMFPVLSLPASAPSLSIPLPPLAEQSSSPDIPDEAPANHTQQNDTKLIPAEPPVSSPRSKQPAVRLPNTDTASASGQESVQSMAQEQARPVAPLPVLSKVELQEPENESELSDISESRPASPMQPSMIASSQGEQAQRSNTVQPLFDAAEIALDAALADASATFDDSREKVPDPTLIDSELSDLEEDEALPETPKKQSTAQKASKRSEQSRSKSRSSSAKARASSRKPSSEAITSTAKAPSRISPAKRGRPRKRPQEEADLADGEDNVREEKKPKSTNGRKRKENSPEHAEASEEDDGKADSAATLQTDSKKAPSTTRSRGKSAIASPEATPARTPVRRGGRKKKVKRGRRPKGHEWADTTTKASALEQMQKPSRTISQKKLKEIYSDKSDSFVTERLRSLEPHVRFHSFNEVEDYDLVWARSNKQAPYWPAEICLDIDERDGDVPQAVLDADPNKHANRQKSDEANESTSKRIERVFDRYVLVQWFPQISGTKSSWSWVPFDPDYMTRIGESKEYDALMQNRFPAIVRKRKKGGTDDTKRIRAAYEDCFTNMETPPPSDSEEELQDLAEA